MYHTWMFTDAQLEKELAYWRQYPEPTVRLRKRRGRPDQVSKIIEALEREQLKRQGPKGAAAYAPSQEPTS
jgi:hypothetical protein